MSLFIAIFVFLGVILVSAFWSGKRFAWVLRVCAGWIAAALAIATGVGALMGRTVFHAVLLLFIVPIR